MLDQMRLTQLVRSPSIVRFPEISHPQPVQGESHYRPVLRTKRYNQLKLQELKHLQEKDRRMGRLESERSRDKQLMEDERRLLCNSVTYQLERQERYKRLLNSSFNSLMERIKENSRYFSIEK
jgi:hypothetical protein